MYNKWNSIRSIKCIVWKSKTLYFQVDCSFSKIKQELEFCYSNDLAKQYHNNIGAVDLTFFKRLIFAQVFFNDLIKNLAVYFINEHLLGKFLLRNLNYARNKVLQEV